MRQNRQFLSLWLDGNLNRMVADDWTINTVLLLPPLLKTTASCAVVLTWPLITVDICKEWIMNLYVSREALWQLEGQAGGIQPDSCCVHAAHKTSYYFRTLILNYCSSISAFHTHIPFQTDAKPLRRQCTQHRNNDCCSSYGLEIIKRFCHVCHISEGDHWSLVIALNYHCVVVFHPVSFYGLSYIVSLYSI